MISQSKGMRTSVSKLHFWSLYCFSKSAFHRGTSTTQFFVILLCISGHVEHFADKCGGVPAWLDESTYYTAFTEGWGLYSENPVLSDDTDTYKDNLLQKYGMAKWQVS